MVLHSYETNITPPYPPTLMATTMKFIYGQFCELIFTCRQKMLRTNHMCALFSKEVTHVLDIYHVNTQ
jgi:hypothetical protein